MNFAPSADIIRAQERDQYYIQQLSHPFMALSNQKPKWRPWIQVASQALYYGLTTLHGYPTLGEEYCHLQSTVALEPVTFPRRLLFYTVHVWMPVLGGLLAKKLFGTDSEKMQKWNTLKHVVKAIHRSLFFFQVKYYHVSHRCAQLSFLSMTPKSNEPYRNFYKLLGILILIQVIVQTLLKQGWNTQDSLLLERKGDSSLPMESLVTSPLHSKCILCFDPLLNPTCTPCGHVFCWYCVADWVQQKPECPLCKHDTRPSDLFLLVL